MRESIAKSILETADDLHKTGLIDRYSLANIEKLCLPDVPDYKPEEIIAIRRKLNLSQAALAALFNISTSTVQKWEQGRKKPTGATKKLLNIAERRGINAFI